MILIKLLYWLLLIASIIWTLGTLLVVFQESKDVTLVELLLAWVVLGLIPFLLSLLLRRLSKRKARKFKANAISNQVLILAESKNGKISLLDVTSQFGISDKEAMAIIKSHVKKNFARLGKDYRGEEIFIYDQFIQN
jgi:hypothetical protein